MARFFKSIITGLLAAGFVQGSTCSSNDTMKIWNDPNFSFIYNADYLVYPGISISILMCKDKCLATEECLAFHHFAAPSGYGEKCTMYSKTQMSFSEDNPGLIDVFGEKCGHESAIETIHDELYPNNQATTTTAITTTAATTTIATTTKLTTPGEFKGETYPNKSLENFPEFCKRWKFSMAIKPDAAKAEPQSILHISDGEFTGTKGARLPMILLIPNTPVLQAVFNSQPIRETPEIVFGEWNTMEMEQYK